MYLLQIWTSSKRMESISRFLKITSEAQVLSSFQKPYFRIWSSKYYRSVGSDFWWKRSTYRRLKQTQVRSSTASSVSNILGKSIQACELTSKYGQRDSAWWIQIFNALRASYVWFIILGSFNLVISPRANADIHITDTVQGWIRVRLREACVIMWAMDDQSWENLRFCGF